MPRRVKIGDIIEIPTSKGLAYAQHTHKNQDYGPLIRVIDGLFESRPVDLDMLTKRRHRFVVFFPLGAAVNRRIFAVIGHAEIPVEARPFPLFRDVVEDRTGKIKVWWLWDGQKSWRIGELQREQCELPMRVIVNDTALIWMIESGYTPETDPRSRDVCS